MKNDIKEILKDLEFASGIFDYTITPDRCTFLKDYITNLQQENERLRGDNEFLKKEIIKLERKYLKEDLSNILQNGSDDK